MKITAVESFDIEIPISEQQRQLKYYHRSGVTRILTDEGITGYGWSVVDAEAASAMLVDKDPIQVERLVSDGLGGSCSRRNRLGWLGSYRNWCCWCCPWSGRMSVEYGCPGEA